jgi:metal-responsive CopG/Arc/MetJ family transcriptional regulator
MRTIQVVLETALLRATDRAARRLKVNRSAFVRDALRAHLRRLLSTERERRDREGYERLPDSGGGWAAWEREIAWPDE